MNFDYNFYPVDQLAESLSTGTPVLTPNHRLARRIRLAWGHLLSGSGNAAWRTPRVMSLDHWWQHCYRERSLAGDSLPGLLSPDQERALWLQCVSESDNLALLRPGVAAELAADAYRNLALWDIDWRSPSVAQQFGFGEDTAIFLEWAERFETSLSRLGLASLPALVPTLSQTCPEQTIVLAEFDDLPPRYRAALTTQANSLEHYRAGSEQAACQLLACASHADELQAAARWAFQQHSEAPKRRVAILLPQLQQERADIERVLVAQFGSDPRRPETLPVNFSAGLPMSYCGPVRAALALLALPVREQSLAALGETLYSRYRCRDGLSEEELALARLIEDAREPVSPATLRAALGRADASDPQREGPSLAQVLVAAGQARTLRSRHPAAAWPALFTDLLTELGWPGSGPLDSLEYQQVEQFQSLLAGLAQLTPVSPEMDYRAALAALEQLCANSIFQAKTPDAPIQVLGTLEAAGLQFDAVWVCGMGAGEWPAAARPNPFIPVQLQRNAGMPHADAQRELSYAEQLLDHLRRSTPLLIASYACLDADVETAPSPLLADFTPLPAAPAEHWPGHWEVATDATAVERVALGTAPAVSAMEASEIGGGSAILGNQAQCPFRAFARHRLNAQPLPEPQVAISAAERGSILHDALYHLWGELGDSRSLWGLDESSRQLLAQRSADTAIENFRQGRGRRESPALLRLEQARLANMLVGWLAVEAEREEFTVSAREERHEIGFGDLSITLRVDRVDRLANGKQLLIDYKTGDVSTRVWLGERPEEPQLPLYTRLLPAEEVEGISFAVLRNSAVEYRGLARSRQGEGISDDIADATGKTDATLANWDELQAHWAQALQSLAREFLDGDARVEPLNRKKTCTFCGLEALCRIR